ncbi:MAG: hypothetical protein J0L58_11370 [Burkholderiales bacterium]|uniref:hypothetical protein n=1 Tax=Inhella sp. TaxID=1921806 RepID=UPI001AD34CE0|nr:hypothetical protein [Burkholderiales bacterium]
MKPPAPLPRGATWHARWLLPLLALLVALLFPWSDAKSPLLDRAQLQQAVNQWRAWQAQIQRAREAKARREMDTAPSADGAVSVRIVPASHPASR